jgi:hypothetical protein
VPIEKTLEQAAEQRLIFDDRYADALVRHHPAIQ